MYIYTCTFVLMLRIIPAALTPDPYLAYRVVLQSASNLGNLCGSSSTQCLLSGLIFPLTKSFSLDPGKQPFILKVGRTIELP